MHVLEPQCVLPLQRLELGDTAASTTVGSWNHRIEITQEAYSQYPIQLAIGLDTENVHCPSPRVELIVAGAKEILRLTNVASEEQGMQPLCKLPLWPTHPLRIIVGTNTLAAGTESDIADLRDGFARAASRAAYHAATIHTRGQDYASLLVRPLSSFILASNLAPLDNPDYVGSWSESVASLTHSALVARV